LLYFQDIEEIEGPITNPRDQKIISPFDNLYIKVLSIDEQTNRLFDANHGNAGLPILISYMVDKNGNIDFPFTGNINVGGLTINQASLKIQLALSEYVPKTSIIVRFIENKITVMGHVEHQGIFSFTQDNLNIYDAIALGGGITQYGDRENVILIRQEGNKIVHRKINLSDSRIANKESYYILPNDVIVVEPMKYISRQYNNTTFTTVLTAITTFLAFYVIFFPNQ
jgi:polysaccharide export outer membrane protein